MKIGGLCLKHGQNPKRSFWRRHVISRHHENDKSRTARKSRRFGKAGVLRALGSQAVQGRSGDRDCQGNRGVWEGGAVQGGSRGPKARVPIDARASLIVLAAQLQALQTMIGSIEKRATEVLIVRLSTAAPLRSRNRIHVERHASCTNPGMHRPRPTGPRTSRATVRRRARAHLSRDNLDENAGGNQNSKWAAGSEP